MSFHARTQNDLFQEFIRNNPERSGYTWTDYLTGLWSMQLKDYYRLGWNLIHLAHRKKVPFAGTKGADDEPLKYSDALQCASEGDNIAVVAKDNLVIVDVDQSEIGIFSGMIHQTRTCKTPRGWAFYTKPPFDEELWGMVKTRYKTISFDTPRMDIMYSLVPVSCVFPSTMEKGRYKRLPGPARIYEWANIQDPIQFSDFCKRAL